MVMVEKLERPDNPKKRKPPVHQHSEVAAIIFVTYPSSPLREVFFLNKKMELNCM